MEKILTGIFPANILRKVPNDARYWVCVKCVSGLFYVLQTSMRTCVLQTLLFAIWDILMRLHEILLVTFLIKTINLCSLSSVSRPALHRIFLNVYGTYSGHNGIEPCGKDQPMTLACHKAHVIGQHSCQEASTIGVLNIIS